MTDAVLRITMDLGNLPARMQQRLKAATNLVAIGLHSIDAITEASMTIPEIGIVHVFDSNNPWSVDQARAAWRLWVLRNGFRDVAETISATLEEAQSALALWRFCTLQKEQGGLPTDWRDAFAGSINQFHRRTLPQKLEFLEKQYGFLLDEDLVLQAMSINATRNCFVHREGMVSAADTLNTEHLKLEWTALATVIVNEGSEQEVVLPYYVEMGSSLAIAPRRRTKQIPIGCVIEVTTSEFAEICWTLYRFAQSCAEHLEKYGKERGFHIEKNNGNAPITVPDDPLDTIV